MTVELRSYCQGAALRHRVAGIHRADQALQERVHTGHYRVEVEQLWRENLVAAEGEQLAGQRACAVGGALDALDIAKDYSFYILVDCFYVSVIFAANPVPLVLIIQP